MTSSSKQVLRVHVASYRESQLANSYVCMYVHILSLVMPDCFFAQGVIACSISARSKK